MLTVRDRRFEIGCHELDAWRERDPAAAALYDSLSVLFPPGERFFMDSVRRYRRDVAGELAADVARFLAQEALHTREHLAFNNQVKAAGYDASRLEARTLAELEGSRRRSALHQLATTVALEHFTALLAHHLIADPRHLAHAPQETRRLWLWHAAEEIEHKAVAFDVFAVATRDWWGVRRWAFRCAVYAETLGKLARVAIPNFRYLRRQYGPCALPLVELAMLLVVGPGLLRRMLPALAAFLCPGFHPSRLDDARLAELALAA